MRRSQQRYLTILVLAVLLAAGWFALKPVVRSVLNALGTSPAEIEAWCGEQVLAIANTYLGPELSFDGLHYAAPESLSVSNVRLVEGETTILEASRLEITLAQVPRPGSPIMIEQITVVDPIVRLVQDNEAGGLIGFRTLIESSEGSTSADGGSTRLSDVFDIRLIQIENGGFEYTDGSGQVQRMSGLTFGMRGEPREAEPGVYGLHINAKRDQVFSMGLEGQLRLDELLADISMFTLSGFVEPDTREVFPPALQAFLVEHDVVGHLSVEASGRVDLNGTDGQDLEATVSMSDCHMDFGAYRIPVDELNATLRLADEVLYVEPLRLTALGGEAEVIGMIEDSGTGAANLGVSAEGMKIQSLYRDQPESPELAGTVTIEATITALMRSLSDSLGGAGEVSINEGRLVHLPVIEDVAETVGAILGTSGSMSDTARSQLTFDGDRIELSGLRVLSSSVAVRGKGVVKTDGSLDLEVNAGVIERAQEALGVLGDLFASVTDKLSKYHIGGQIGQPEISLRPLGL